VPLLVPSSVRLFHAERPELPRECVSGITSSWRVVRSVGLLVAGVSAGMRFVAGSLRKGGGKAGWLAAGRCWHGFIPSSGTTPQAAPTRPPRATGGRPARSVEPYGILGTAGDNDTFRSGVRRKWRRADRVPRQPRARLPLAPPPAAAATSAGYDVSKSVTVGRRRECSGNRRRRCRLTRERCSALPSAARQYRSTCGAKGAELSWTASDRLRPNALQDLAVVALIRRVW
jgi:hypothetical protein